MHNLDQLTRLAKDFHGVFEASDAGTLVDFLNYVAHRQGAASILTVEQLRAPREQPPANPLLVALTEQKVRMIAREELVAYLRECLNYERCT